MKSRHEQRIIIIENLYIYDLIKKVALVDSEYEFVHTVYNDIVNNLQDLDDIISKHLERWTLVRISFVDRAILRLATYELKQTDTPPEIVIDEALELTRAYTDEGDNKAVAFNNSVLDKIRIHLKEVG